MAGFYIHVPFCKSKCVYCDFYSVTSLELIDRYARAVLEEIENISKKYPHKTIETIYFGGGTPAVLPASVVKAIIDRIKASFDCRLSEVTIEVNPTAANDIEHYADCGVDRISIGVQSLDDRVLKFLGRRHNRDEALGCVKKAKQLGYNVSADLMLGIPNSNVEDAKRAIGELSKYVDHISCYILKVEDGTPLFNMVKEGTVLLKDDDDIADDYDIVVKELEKYGFMQYEISNFAKSGKESKHNLKYWTLDDYIGVGPAAHSFIDGQRYYNSADIFSYLNGQNSGAGQAILEEDSAINGVDEYVMLGLRLTSGIDIEKCNKMYNIDVLDRYKKGINKLKDYIEIKNGRLYIKKDKLLLQNDILLTLFDF